MILFRLSRGLRPSTRAILGLLLLHCRQMQPEQRGANAWVPQVDLFPGYAFLIDMGFPRTVVRRAISELDQRGLMKIHGSNRPSTPMTFGSVLLSL